MSFGILYRELHSPEAFLKRKSIRNRAKVLQEEILGSCEVDLIQSVVKVLGSTAKFGRMASNSEERDILFSILIGSIPTGAMLVASFALMNLKVQPLIEACFQNFCAGLILAAVSLELLPLMSPSETTTPFDSVLGTTLGFILGIGMINGVSKVIDGFENASHEHPPDGPIIPKCEVTCKNYVELGKETVQKAVPQWEVSPNGGRRQIVLPWVNKNITSPQRTMETKALSKENESSKILNNGISKQSYSQLGSIELSASVKGSLSMENFDLDRAGCAEDGYDHEAILYAAMAIATPSHRAHIKEHFTEIVNAISVLESNTNSLMRGKTPLDFMQSEKLAEEIDEEIHMLQYRLDHTRR